MQYRRSSLRVKVLFNMETSAPRSQMAATAQIAPDLFGSKAKMRNVLVHMSIVNAGIACLRGVCRQGRIRG
jgi:hypothetical protein